MTGWGTLVEKAVRKIVSTVSGSKPKVQPKDFFFLLCKATIELHPDLSVLQKQGKMSKNKNKLSSAYLLIINGIQNSEGRVMHYE